MTCRPPRLLVLALLLVLCSSTAASASGSRPCNRTGGDVVWQGPDRKILVLRNQNFEDRDVYWLCWRRTGDLRRFAVIRMGTDGSPTSYLGGFTKSGRWFGWARTAAGENGRTTLQSQNARSGKRGPRVTLDRQALVTETTSPTPLLDPLSVGIATNGNFIWLADGKDAAGRDVTAIYVPDGAGGVVQIDRAAQGRIRRLTVSGTVASWRHGSRTSTFAL